MVVTVKSRMRTNDDSLILAMVDPIVCEADPIHEQMARQVGSVTSQLATRLRPAVYDAACLELVDRIGFPFATSDQELRAATGALGIALPGTWRRQGDFLHSNADQAITADWPRLHLSLSSASRIRRRTFSAQSGAVLNGPWIGRRCGSVAGVFCSGS